MNFNLVQLPFWTLFCDGDSAGNVDEKFFEDEWSVCEKFGGFCCKMV